MAVGGEEDGFIALVLGSREEAIEFFLNEEGDLALFPLAGRGWFVLGGLFYIRHFTPCDSYSTKGHGFRVTGLGSGLEP